MERHVTRVADPAVGAGDDPQHVGEVLAAHERAGAGLDALRPDDVGDGLGQRVGLMGMVFENREDVPHVGLDLDLEALGEALAHPDQTAAHQVAHGIVEEADGAGERGLVGNDVVRGAGDDFRDGQDRRLQRIDVTADDALEALGQRRRDHDGVLGVLGTCRMAAAGLDPDIEEERASHRLTREHGDLAGREVRGVVEAVDLVAGEALEEAVGDHRAGASEAFLGRLEHEDGGAGKVARLRQIAGGAEQHGGVAVMPAAVEASGVLGAERQVGPLVHRQGVHVGAKSHPAIARVATPQDADHAGAADAGVGLDPPRLQPLGNDGRRARFLEADLGVGVQVMADGNELVGEIGNPGNDGHGGVLGVRSGMGRALSPRRGRPEAQRPDRRRAGRWRRRTRSAAPEAADGRPRPAAPAGSLGRRTRPG